MSYGRFDDSLSFHPKLAELSDRDYRMLTAGIWAYCARERNGGVFHRSELRHMMYVRVAKTYRCSTTTLDLLVTLGLIDALPNDEFKVHNWDKYIPADPTAAERQRRHRAKQQRDNNARDEALRVTRDSRARSLSSPVTDTPKAVSQQENGSAERDPDELIDEPGPAAPERPQDQSHEPDWMALGLPAPWEQAP
jgi:hypothetical protein